VKRPEGGTSLHTTLMKELERFTEQGWEQEDDVTLFTLERSARRSGPTTAGRLARLRTVQDVARDGQPVDDPASGRACNESGDPGC
jgi:hypothetical protein